MVVSNAASTFAYVCARAIHYDFTLQPLGDDALALHFFSLDVSCLCALRRKGEGPSKRCERARAHVLIHR